MSRVMMLVSAEGETLVETRVSPRRSPAAQAQHDRDIERQLREEARSLGLSADEVREARFVVAGAF